MRIKWIDNAKGIAMLCIIIGHIEGGTFGKIDLSFVHVFHLAVFFLLSGYVLRMQQITTEYVNGKFRRLMTPYFYTCGAIMLIDIFNSIFISKDSSILTITNILAKDIARSFFASGTFTTFADIDMGRCIGAIWFLPAMFFALLIVQWILNYYAEEWKQWAVAILIALLGYISSRYIWFPFSIQSGMTASVFILAGYYIKKYTILEKFKFFHYTIFIIFFVFGVCREYDHFYIVINHCPDLIISFCVAFSGSFIIFKVAQYTEKIDILNFVGRQSLLFLCVHLVALETMGWYFNYIIALLGITGVSSLWATLALHIMFAMFGTFIILSLKKLRKGISFTSSSVEVHNEEKDHSADIMRGILVISMLVGNAVIDAGLRRIIYSCHIVAFVFLEGYFYQPVRNLSIGIIRLYKSFLLPYGCFCLAHLVLHLDGISISNLMSYLKRYILAISFSEKLFVDIPSIGPIYFICILFLIRIIYLFISYFTNSVQSSIFIVILLSFIGAELGNYGYWLPWSLDCALYCLIFYEIGIISRRLNLLDCVSGHSGLYFILSTIWAYMIYTYSMEVAVRQYAPYGLVIFGAMSGILLIYMLSRYVSVNMMSGIRNILEKSGKSMLYIVIAHGLLGGYIYNIFLKYLNGESIFHLVVCISFQILIGIMIKWIKDRTVSLISNI